MTMMMFPISMTTTTTKQRERRSIPSLFIRMAVTVAVFSRQNHNSVFVYAVDNPCTICADGSTPEGEFPGTTNPLDCVEFEDTVKSTPANDTACDDLRLQAYRYCSCPTFPEDKFCSLCGLDADSEFQELPREYGDYHIPSSDGTSVMTCKEAAFLEISDDSGDKCDDYKNYAWYCGCPDATRGVCTLCGSSDDQNKQPNNRYLPPSFITCQELDRFGGTIYDNNCDTLLTNDSTNSNPSEILDVKSYCGCTDDSAEPPNTCQLCGDGVVMNPNLKVLDGVDGAPPIMCMHLDKMASYVTNDGYCSELQMDYAQQCCQALPMPTDAPATMEPAEATTTAPLPTAAPVVSTDPPAGDRAATDKKSSSSNHHHPCSALLVTMASFAVFMVLLPTTGVLA